MKFSENWLRAYVNPDLDSDQLAHALTMSGLEVEAMESVAPPFDKVVVGEVLSLEKHPDADRLNVCQVNVGAAESLQIVCGAANVSAGVKVPCAMVGAQLPKMAIKQAKVRGVESSGMLCSETELGLAEESSGLLLLPSDAVPGQSIRDYLGLDDKLYTLKLTPNRSDCLSITGVAREVSALTGAVFTLPDVAATPVAIADKVAVAVSEPASCPRYCGRVMKGLNAKAATPEWMAQRLKRSGLRPINAIVDVTNYVLLELGQPLHAFDLAKIQGGLNVRFARSGEQLELLDQQVVALDADMLVISDATQALALAGVMGGQSSAVTDATADIFLESAFFNPDVIVGKARRLTISTDSSYRFERGVDFAATRSALERATVLLLEICGGVAGEIIEITAELPLRVPIQLRVARIGKVLGVALSATQIAALLVRLQLAHTEVDGVFQVTPPSYRFDLTIEVDLIEEIARLYGYDNIPALPPVGGMNMLPQSETSRDRDVLRSLLAGHDYQEVINYSFVDAEWERDLAGNDNPLPLKNPIASQMSVMRSSLLGSLIAVLKFNLDRKAQRVRLFELGRVFRKDASVPDSDTSVAGFDQPMRVAGLAYGSVDSLQWGSAERGADFFDVKGDVQALLAPLQPGFKPAEHPAMHPGRCASVWLGERCVGHVGELHPKWRQAYDLTQAPVMFELALDAVLQRDVPVFQTVSRHQPVERDLAIVVKESVTHAAVVDAIRSGGGILLRDVVLFDVYRPKRLADGSLSGGLTADEKSLAVRLTLNRDDATLTEEEIESVVKDALDALSRRVHARLR